MKILQAISAGELVPLSKDNLTETSRVKWMYRYIKLYFKSTKTHGEKKRMNTLAAV